ncbi:MAG: 50S ribosomal protein L19 [Candidatus Woesebacteria bacterium GW2011_GWB1_38_5b]|uniref:50S ribosomal protein L19 n=1 Tax=Candidatus Woesebacteria bacterium GW2011_GWB1_38_5b TaxID=1618569 RepID=A0A0G0KAQ2_9BACT|nr:MAG: 50S ribosomal protein L19 [Candidatus Woesebacteria bacterium GW2011_GWB1_38_5b]
MAIITTHNNIVFGVGDTVRVHQKIQEGEKSRVAVFEGMVIGIKGEAENKSFTVRRVGAQKIGIEQIFPLSSPRLEKIEVKRSGVRGVRQAKLYFIRDKSKREIEKIYSRAAKRGLVKK